VEATATGRGEVHYSLSVMKARTAPHEVHTPPTKKTTQSADPKVQQESQLPCTSESKSNSAILPNPTAGHVAFPSQVFSTEKTDVHSDVGVALESLSTTEDDFVALIDQSSGSEAIMQVELVQVTDSGGQPQFHEVLTVFLRRTSAYVFVLKLYI